MKRIKSEITESLHTSSSSQTCYSFSFFLIFPKPVSTLLVLLKHEEGGGKPPSSEPEGLHTSSSSQTDFKKSRIFFNLISLSLHTSSSSQTVVIL